METTIDLAKALLGFLSVEATADEKGWIGAMLVTDINGLPLEFRCTTAVKPDTLQRTLYGQKLEPFIKLELCAKRILSQVQRKPRVIFVNSEILLELEPDTDLPVIYIQPPGGSVPLVTPVSNGVERGRVESGGEDPKSLVFWYSKENNPQETQALMGGIFQKFNLIEPFDRSRAALKLLAEQDPKYS